ncbi:proteasome assembly chaperone family protein, partial [Candidatus Pacearchaeota archaeon]
MKNRTYVRVLRDMKFKSPVVVEGLPGIGLVGKIAAEHLARELKAKRIAEVYSPHFPHQVIMRKDGTIRMLRNVIYGYKKGKKEVVILLGDVQAITSEAQFEVTNRLIDYFKSINAKRVYTLGGYGSGKHIANPRVLGAATHKRLVEEHEKYGVVFGKSKGTIIGVAGMLLGLGKLRGMEGVCLMGETHGAYVDANSAKALLKKLCKI